MRFSQIISETSAGATGSGSVATVSSPLGATQSRGNPSIYGGQKVGNLFKGKKTNKPFANSINEGKEERERNAKMAQATDYEKRAKATKNDTKKAHYQKMADEIRRSIKTSDEISEAKLDEEDKIIAVGKGKKLKTGLHGKSEESKMKGFKAPFKHQGVFVSDKRGNKVCECENEGVAQEVAKALSAYAVANEGAGVIAGGLQYESEVEEGLGDTIKKGIKNIKRGLQGWDKNAVGPGGEKLGDPKDIVRRNKAHDDATVRQLAKDKELGFPFGGDSTTGKHSPRGLQKRVLDREIKKRGLAQEGAKVDRMVKHIASSERKLGKSKDEAENIAWATANKRGMLDNKNKKKGK